MTDILVLSRNKLEAFAYDPARTYAIISITDPSQPFVKVPGVYTVLRLQFHDLDRDFNEYYAMTEAQADLVADLVRVWWGAYDFILVQCEAGISRSAGVAAAIAKWGIGDDNKYFNGMRYIPNRRCYRIVLERLMTK